MIDHTRVHTPLVLPNPALVEEARKRSQSIENRIADRITAFSGSMCFVYLPRTVWISRGSPPAWRWPWG